MSRPLTQSAFFRSKTAGRNFQPQLTGQLQLGPGTYESSKNGQQSQKVKRLVLKPARLTSDNMKQNSLPLLLVLEQAKYSYPELYHQERFLSKEI